MNDQLTLGKADGPSPAAPADETLLELSGVEKHFPVMDGFLFKRQVGAVHAVDGIDLTVARGESLGLVGESGCGKSTTGRLVTRLLEPTAGRITYRGQDISHAGRKELAPIRSEIQMIFQDPYSSLNPRQTVGSIIGSPMEINGISPAGGIQKRVQELLETVGLNPEHYNRFPHEFSGGQRQRIGVARALALQPKLIVADEPVSALDVSIQAQVVNLLQQLQQDLGIAFLFIAHDLAVVRHFSQRVAVMYLGRIVEIADRASLYERPRHPYTHALLSAVPEADPDDDRERIRLAGDVPSPINPPSGCRFRTRCWKAQEKCATEVPPLVRLPGNAEGHLTACHFPEDPTVERAESVLLDPALAAAESITVRSTAPERGDTPADPAESTTTADAPATTTDPANSDDTAGSPAPDAAGPVGSAATAPAETSGPDAADDTAGSPAPGGTDSGSATDNKA